MSKKIKQTDIDPAKLITKSRLAKKLGTTPTTINDMIKRGELVVVQADGVELVHQ
jgi:hypothetical protein